MRPLGIIFVLFFNEYGDIEWRELTNRAIGNEKTNMVSGKEWKPKMAEQYFREEDQRAEKN